MDQQAESKKLMLLIYAFVAFLVTGFFSYVELKYAVWGEHAEATVTRIYEKSYSGRGGRRRRARAVEYTFTDAHSRNLRERDEVPLSWIIRDPKVRVQYLPDVPDSSRLEGHSKLWAVWAFLASVVWMTYAIISLAREAHVPIPRRRR